MKKRILSLCMILVLCLGLLPTTVLAAVPDRQVLYVGGVEISSTGYWTTDSEGNVTAYSGAGIPSDSYIHYDAEDNILTLHNATIKKGVSAETNSFISDVAIGVLNQSGDAELTITLEGDNTIDDVSIGIYVLAHSSTTGTANLTITGNGSLTTSGFQNGIRIQSNSGDATLSIQNAAAEATVTDWGDGIMIQSGESSNASLSVEGGSLTTDGNGNSVAGIRFAFGGSGSGSGTPSLNVRGNSIVKASGGDGGITTYSSPVTPSGTGIVFDNGIGTVYGNVTLQEDLEIGEGESLTLDDGASLDANGHNVIVDGGMVDDNIKNSLGDNVKYTPTITTTSLPNGTVGTYYEQKLTADGTEPIKWSISNGNLPAGLSLNKNTGEISGTPTVAGSNTFTITAENAYGMKTRQLAITVDDTLVYSVSLTPNIVKFPSLIEGYEPQDPKTITIKNTGNQTIKIAYYGSGGSEFDIALDKTVLKPNEEATLTIRLKDGLSAATPSTLKTSIRYTSEDGTYENRVPYEVYSSIRHDMDYIEAKDPTHLEDGNIEYWYCSYCDKCYEHGSGLNELSMEDIIIPRLSEHSSTGIWHYDDNGHYHVCECGAILDQAAHSYKWVIDKEATSTSTGLKHEECTICGHQKETVVIPTLEVEIPDTLYNNIASRLETLCITGIALSAMVFYRHKRKYNK